MKKIQGTSYEYEPSQDSVLREIGERVAALRATGALTPEVLHTLRRYFRIKNIYHSNAIEGNQLTVGETRQVVEQGLTLTGKSLKDQAEAKNLAEATDYLEELVRDPAQALTLADVRTIHHLVLSGLDDQNAGAFRVVPVEISGSQFKPPGPESIASEMERYAEWLGKASVPGDRFGSPEGLLVAAVAHTWLVYVHPFIDGNGRVARLLMNLLLMRYGVPIAIIGREDRLRYYDSLERSQIGDISAFIGLLCECVHESLEEYEVAATEQREREEWARSIAEQMGAAEEARARNRYEVWKGAQELLKGYMRQTASMIDEANPFIRVYFKDFGALEFEKWVSLGKGRSAKRTWFFRVDFVLGERTARYLFFFGSRSPALRECGVTLHIAREEPPNTYNYERLELITSPDVPNLVEIGYDSKAERFVSHHRDGATSSGKIERLGRLFFEDVKKKHFSS